MWAAFKKIPLIDSTRDVRNAWGILAEDLEAAAADDLVRSLRAAQISAQRLLANALVQPPAPKPIRRFELSGSDAIPFEKLAVIGAALFDQTSIEHTQQVTGPSAAQKALSIGILMTTGIPVRVGGKKQVVQKQETHSELVGFLDLCSLEPSARWRIDAQNFDYSFLKEKKTYSVLSNFKLLLAHLTEQAPRAIQNRGTRVLLAGQAVREMGYRSLADLDRELRWLLTLAKTGLRI